MLPNVMMVAASVAFANILWTHHGSLSLRNLTSDRLLVENLASGKTMQPKLSLQLQKERMHEEETDEVELICAPICTITCFAAACIVRDNKGQGGLLPQVRTPQLSWPKNNLLVNLRNAGTHRLRGGAPNPKKPTTNPMWEKSYQAGKPTIWAAARVGDLEGLRQILDRGGPGSGVNDMENEERTALHWAVAVANVECAKELISRGARIDTVDDHGWSPIHTAASTGNMEVMDLLATAAKQARLGPEFFAAQTCNTELATPLHCAAGKQHLEALEFLLNATTCGADVTDGKGRTPLIKAAAAGYIPGVELLLKHGADINTQDDDGNSSLHYACDGEDEEMISYLITHGADPRLPNFANYMPVDCLGFDMAKRIGRVYNDYKRDMGLKCRTAEEQAILENKVLEEYIRMKSDPAMTFYHNRAEGDAEDGIGAEGDSQTEDERMRTNVYLPTDIM